MHFTKIASNVKKIISDDKERFVLKNDGVLWGWNPIYDSNHKITKNKPQKLLSNIVKVQKLWSRYDDEWYIYAIDENGVLWKGNSSGFKKLMDKVTEVFNQESSNQHKMGVYVLKNNGILYEYYKEETNNTNSTKVKYINKMDKTIEGVKSITTDGDVFMVVKKDKSLWSWGCNEYGKVGDGTKVKRVKPKKILDNVQSVTFKDTQDVFALKEDGSLWAWGDNVFGMVGMSSDSNIPTKIISDVNYLNRSSMINIVIKKDGSIWTWGYHNHVTGVKKNAVPQELILE